MKFIKHIIEFGLRPSKEIMNDIIKYSLQTQNNKFSINFNNKDFYIYFNKIIQEYK